MFELDESNAESDRKAAKKVLFARLTIERPTRIEERVPTPWSARMTLLRAGQVDGMNQEDQQLNLEIASAILLIDDNAIQAATRQTILRRAGYFVIVALSPVRALEQFRHREFPAEISLVITDHIMPGMSGSQFVHELRKIQPRLPVMVISGMEEAEDEYDGLDVLFLVKPVAPDLMLANLRHLLEHQEAGAA